MRLIISAGSEISPTAARILAQGNVVGEVDAGRTDGVTYVAVDLDATRGVFEIVSDIDWLNTFFKNLK